MTFFDMIVKEISHRSGLALAATAAVAVAVSGVICGSAILKRFDIVTERIVAEKEKEASEQTQRLEEEYRKIGTSMGFNILILPKNQSLSDLYANDYASQTMPAWYVDTLAHSKIATIQHLLPMLQQKVLWPERKRTVLVVGTMGEVNLLFGEGKKPLRDNVSPGSIYLGYELHKSMGLKKGETIRFMGTQFTIAGCYPERGTKDDITLWINLAQAQRLFHKEGCLNGILALECQCAMGKPDSVRAEIGSILPNTQIVEFASQALARAESRAKAAAFAKAAVDAEKKTREVLRREKEKYVGIFIPLLVILCVASVGILSYVNVRQRRKEFGILRAVGFTASSVAILVSGRSLIIGGIGAAAGAAAGIGAIDLFTHKYGIGFGSLVDAGVVVWALIAAPACAIVCGWLGAAPAFGSDPAEIVKGE